MTTTTASTRHVPPEQDARAVLDLICALLRGEHGPDLQAYARAAVGEAWSTCPRTAHIEPGIVMTRIFQRVAS